ncbi:MAG: GDSL-type esterase/lipase family protein [Bacteriovoracaceae bacterium]
MKTSLCIMCFIILLFATSFKASAGYWDKEIQEFRQIDSQNGVPISPALFVGSSTIRLWDTQKYFSGIPFLNRGFGGSQVKDLLNYYYDVIGKYNPSAIVLYSGDNDLDFGKGVQEVFFDFQNLIKAIRKQTNNKIIWLLPKKSPARSYLYGKINSLNSMIYQKYLSSQNLIIVDLNSFLNLPSNSPRFFQEDGIHFNDSAYNSISVHIREMLAQ